MESIIYENLHEKTLQDISYEVIRQNWTSYQDIMCNSPYYDLLWENWEKKHNIDKTDIYLMLFKQFIHNEDCNRTKPWFDRIYVEQVNPETLILKGLNGSERKHIHILCDQIGFHHKSISQQKKYVRFLYIYKPNTYGCGSILNQIPIRKVENTMFNDNYKSMKNYVKYIIVVFVERMD